MMKSVLIFCLLAGLQVVYSSDGTNVQVFQETKTVTYDGDGKQGTITYHTMKIPAQSFFFPSSSSQGETQKFVRNRASPEIPKISFNNGDIQHIIEEMHLVPKQRKTDNQDDFDVQAILFSIDPSDEDLGNAMKKNRHVETRVPLFFRQVPSKVIPQAPAQRKSFSQAPSQEELKALPSKHIESASKPIKYERYEPVESHKPDTQGTSKVRSSSKSLNTNQKGHDSDGIFSDYLDDLFTSFMKQPFSSESVSDVEPSRTREVSHASPKVPTQSAHKPREVVYLNSIPREFREFMESMEESDGLFQNVFSSPFFF